MIMFKSNRHIQVAPLLFFLIAGWIVIHQPLDCFAGNSDAGYQVRIEIKETSRIDTEKISLGQVGQIHANDLLKESLEKLVLGNAPKPDKIKAFSKDRIISLIRSQSYLPESLIIICPDHVYVKRNSQTVSLLQIRNFVESEIKKQYPGKKSEIVSISVNGLDIYPQGKLSFRTDDRSPVDTRGKLSMFIEILINGNKIDRVNVRGKVEVYDSVLCAARDFKKGESISGDDVVLLMKNIFDLHGQFIDDFQSVDKMIVKKPVDKGTILKTDLFTKPVLVKKGDVVSLIAQNSHLRIITSGICKEDGYENALIRVENLSSGKLIRGVVKGKSRVEVVY